MEVDINKHMIIEISILIIISILFGKISSKLGLAIVVGQLISGIVLGPAGFSIIHFNHIIDILAEVGVWLLMFNAGLETDLNVLIKNIKMSSYVAICGVLSPLIVFYITALFIGYNINEALLWGIVFSATSISITLSVLSEQDLLSSKLGAVIMGAAILDDIIALIMISSYTVYMGTSGLKITAIMPIIMFTFGLLIKRIFNINIIEKTIKITGDYILYPIFFGSVGLRISTNGISKSGMIIIILILLAVLTKMIGAGLGAKINGADNKFSLAIGAGMISRGEMSLIIASLALNSNIVKPSIFTEMVIVTIVSTILAPIIMKPLFKKM